MSYLGFPMEKQGLHNYRTTITLVSVTAILGAQEAAKTCWGYLSANVECIRCVPAKLNAMLLRSEIIILCKAI